MTTDTLTRAMTTAAVLLVAALAAVVSFAHIRNLALTHGGDQLTSALLPLLIDGTVAAMSLVMLRAARCQIPSPWLARFMLVLSVGATLAANTAFGAAFGLTGALLWTLPAVMFVGCVEVSVLMVRKTRPAAVPVPPGPVVTPLPEPSETPAPLTVPLQVREVVMADPELFTLSASQLAEKHETSDSTIARARRDAKKLAMANGNGKAH